MMVFRIFCTAIEDGGFQAAPSVEVNIAPPVPTATYVDADEAIPQRKEAVLDACLDQ
jgi:hypothetical protein